MSNVRVEVKIALRQNIALARARRLTFRLSLAGMHRMRHPSYASCCSAWGCWQPRIITMSSLSNCGWKLVPVLSAAFFTHAFVYYRIQHTLLVPCSWIISECSPSLRLVAA
jgi:hypothetical protein